MSIGAVLHAYQVICEKCGKEMERGYGLAGGGGIGPYFYCANEACEDPKLVKFSDPEMRDDEPRQDRS